MEASGCRSVSLTSLSLEFMVSDTKERGGKKKRTITMNTRPVCIVKESRYVGELQYATSWHNLQ